MPFPHKMYQDCGFKETIPGSAGSTKGGPANPQAVSARHGRNHRMPERMNLELLEQCFEAWHMLLRIHNDCVERFVWMDRNMLDISGGAAETLMSGA